jgi:hypothetical protein
MSNGRDTLVALAVEYAALREAGNAGQLRLAVLEHQIWNQLKLDQKDGLDTSPVEMRRNWFHRRFSPKYGGNISDYMLRNAIYNAGSWAHPLFDRVDHGFIKLSAAALVVREAKKMAKGSGIDQSTALARIIETPTKCKQPAPISTESDITFDGSAGTNSKAFLHKAHALAAAYVEVAFASTYIDKYYKDRLIADFKDSLDLAVAELRKGIYKTKLDTKDDGIQEIGETNFVWACEVLGFTYSFGDPVDMKAVKTRKNKRSLELHPDRNQDSPGVRAEFERVQEAYIILESYSRKSNRRATNDKD